MQLSDFVGCVFAATNSVKKPKSIIRTPRTNFVIKLVRYDYNT